MGKKKKPQLTIAAADCETDPFKMGRLNITPFSWGIYDGSTYHEFWGDDATEQFVSFLKDYPEPLTIYAHNGGKFDWLFLFKYLSGDMRFIGSRLVQANLFHHELRDSFANMPVPLRSFEDKSVGNKIEFDYSKLERNKRKKHKKEILAYQKQDVLVLYNAVTQWLEMFGEKPLTMASAAMNELKASLAEMDIKVETLKEWQDRELRPFYFGGRVCCFEKGIVLPRPGREWKVFDVNSMYPDAMKSERHPIGAEYKTKREITDETDFAIIDATSRGALPFRAENGSVGFPHGRKIFHATGHEIRAALELGSLEIHRVLEAREFLLKMSFDDFVDKFYTLRLKAKLDLNEMYVLFYKLVLNSAYGKFAINPDDFADSVLLPVGEFPDDYVEDGEWFEKVIIDDFGLVLWERPARGRKHSYMNVATAASITGAARAKILRGLALATRPVYCDTDSIICEDFAGDCHDSELGKWKFEGAGKVIAIAGKKMYALTDGYDLAKDGSRRMKDIVKTASKGVNIPANEIILAAQGQTITYTAEAPVFKIGGRQLLLTRRIRNTAKIEAP
ncbi:DNA polymerase [Gluconobacter phage GC1]|uniref:DNA-directed DNA polymerase n=1 Tax=Gluconobacter phage GC1 TaxID=2047788 RepID=A0A2I5AR55_9VIRU|nr:DNA polymerase [Gluconobacter phage GC1]ATS92570.1 DNA polymerase [Gluconobacter phage GC1]